MLLGFNRADRPREFLVATKQVVEHYVECGHFESIQLVIDDLLKGHVWIDFGR